MKVAFPVTEPSGSESKVYNHFGSAPAFVIADSETSEIDVIANADKEHAHGNCSPVKALMGREVDCAVVGGIGAGALTKLGMLGIPVYRAGAESVAENLRLLAEGRLKQFATSELCPGHGQGRDCAH